MSATGQSMRAPQDMQTITETDVLDEQKPCNLCKSWDYVVTIDGRYGKIVRCTSCGLMYRKTMVGRYPIHCYGGVNHHRQQVADKQVLQLADYAQTLPILERYCGTHGTDRSLLEIGSYHGEFLRLASERGYRVVGVEPNAELAAHCKEVYPHFTIHTSFLRDVGFSDHSFDVVCLFHVIEHMNYPLEELMEIHRILKPGGIAVIETPRYDTVWFRVLKERERSVIPEHFYFFTRSSLSRMVEKAGLSVVRTDNVGRTLTIDRLLGNICKVLNSPGFARVVNGISERLRLNRLKVYINTGDMMRLYAIKSCGDA